MYFKLTRKELAEKLTESRKTIDYVNPVDKHFWPNTYLVGLTTGCYWYAMFLVHGSYCGDDLWDVIADYCEKKGYAYFAEESYLEELRKDAVEAGYGEEDFIEEQYIVAGNHYRYVNAPGIVYELVKK